MVAAVAFLAVAQQQIRAGEGTGFSFFHGFRFIFNDEDHETDPVPESGTYAARSGAATGGNNSYYGLVGLSLTYALPIVGDDVCSVGRSLFVVCECQPASSREIVK